MARRFEDYTQPAGRPVSAGGGTGRAELAPAEVILKLRVWLTCGAGAALLTAVLLSRIFPAQALRWQFVPLLVGIIVLGLPHGALDHLAPLFLLHRCLSPRYLFVFILAYGTLVMAYLWFWHLWPAGALVIFLLLSWLHWGQGDAYYLHRVLGQPSPSGLAGRLLIWSVRGALPIALPVLAHPQVFALVTGGILHWYGGQAGWVLAPSMRGAGFVTLALLIGLYMEQSWRLDRRVFWYDAGEILLLLLYFVLVPPILAVGIYFCLWHSARHIARLLLLDPGSAGRLACGRIRACVLRTAGQALPMTFGALALLTVLFWQQGKVQVAPDGFTYLYLSLIAALTFPHFLLVCWMDWRERD